MSTMIITWQQINNIYYVFFEFLRKAIEEELAKYKKSKYEGIISRLGAHYQAKNKNRENQLLLNRKLHCQFEYRNYFHL